MSSKYWKNGDDFYIGDCFGSSTEITKEEFNSLLEQKALKEEVSSLKAYLADTDYIYPKCLELALDVDVVYADVVTQRKTARERVQLLEGN